jgi:hypothetical protein
MRPRPHVLANCAVFKVRPRAPWVVVPSRPGPTRGLPAGRPASRSVSQNSAACGTRRRQSKPGRHARTPGRRASRNVKRQTDALIEELPRKEVIQPHLPVRLPCYDFTPITSPTFDGSLPKVGSPASGVTRFRGVTGGVYKARERIHPSVADLGLLATPPSWRRVSASNPNRDRLCGIRSTSRYRNPLYRPM